MKLPRVCRLAQLIVRAPHHQARHQFLYDPRVEHPAERAGREHVGLHPVNGLRGHRGGAELGRVSWYGPWRCYTIEPDEGTVFNSTCLRDIAAFLAEQTQDHLARARRLPGHSGCSDEALP